MIDPEKRAKEVLSDVIFYAKHLGYDIDTIITELRKKGFRIAPITQWGKDPSGRW